MVKNPLAMQETLVSFLGQKIPWRRDRLPTPLFLGFPCGSASKESSYNVGDPGSIPGLGRSPGEEKGYPLQNPGLENSEDCIVHGVAESDTTEQLSLLIGEVNGNLEEKSLPAMQETLVRFLGWEDPLGKG